MPNETYEGWSNRETWAVANAIDNNEAELHETMAYVQRNPPTLGVPLAVMRDIIGDGIKARFLRSLTRDTIELRASLRETYGAISDAPINWRSLAEHYMAKARDVHPTPTQRGGR